MACPTRKHSANKIRNRSINHTSPRMAIYSYSMTDETEEFSIMGVSEDGEQITLSDNSIWNIRPGDISKSACWYETQRVLVEGTTNKAYPYKFTNLDTAGPDVCAAKLA